MRSKTISLSSLALLSNCFGTLMSFTGLLIGFESSFTTGLNFVFPASLNWCLFQRKGGERRRMREDEGRRGGRMEEEEEGG